MGTCQLAWYANGYGRKGERGTDHEQANQAEGRTSSPGEAAVAGRLATQSDTPFGTVARTYTGSSMRTIETTAMVSPDGTLTARVPPDVAPGAHQVVLVIDEPQVKHGPERSERQPLVLPTIHVGAWPADLSLRREDMYGDEGR